jgi:hypothetical protein
MPLANRGYYRGSRQHPFARLLALQCSSPGTLGQTIAHEAGPRQCIIDGLAYGPPIRWLFGRDSLGSVEPYHFLFPYKRGNRPYDPTRQMADSGLQKRWNALRQAAGMPWLTPHVLRYQCITKMAEVASTGLQRCEWLGTSPTRCRASTLKCAWTRCERN